MPRPKLLRLFILQFVDSQLAHALVLLTVAIALNLGARSSEPGLRQWAVEDHEPMAIGIVKTFGMRLFCVVCAHINLQDPPPNSSVAKVAS